MRIHLIAIGGSVMHNLAISLQKAGHSVSGSDDEIYDPAKTRLEQHGLLPEKYGWNKRQIGAEIDLVILGMHARKDNVELLTALDLGISVVSIPTGSPISLIPVSLALPVTRNGRLRLTTSFFV